MSDRLFMQNVRDFRSLFSCDRRLSSFSEFTSSASVLAKRDFKFDKSSFKQAISFWACSSCIFNDSSDSSWISWSDVSRLFETISSSERLLLSTVLVLATGTLCRSSAAHPLSLHVEKSSICFLFSGIWLLSNGGCLFLGEVRHANLEGIVPSPIPFFCRKCLFLFLLHENVTSRSWYLSLMKS